MSWQTAEPFVWIVGSPAASVGDGVLSQSDDIDQRGAGMGGPAFGERGRGLSHIGLQLEP